MVLLGDLGLILWLFARFAGELVETMITLVFLRHLQVKLTQPADKSPDTKQTKTWYAFLELRSKPVAVGVVSDSLGLGPSEGA